MDPMHNLFDNPELANMFILIQLQDNFINYLATVTVLVNKVWKKNDQKNDKKNVLVCCKKSLRKLR